MRVCIDGIPLLLRSAGVKTYLYYWITHLQGLAKDDQLSIFPFIEYLNGCCHERSILPPLATAARLACLHAANGLGKIIPLADWISGRVDVFHPSQQLQNPPCRCRMTATVYDLTCWLMPEMHSAANVAWSKIFAERVLRRADGLVAISENSRQDAIRILGLNPDKITVIHSGVAPEFFNTTAENAAVVVQKLGLAGSYVLFVGAIEPRKNLATLLEAWTQLPHSITEEFALVIAGPRAWGDPAVLNRLRMGIPGIRYLGYVSEADLPGLTAGATVFVYPSLYEGFGLPVAQAMAAGVPVITSNLSSLPEVAGDAALLVDPRSAEEIRAALERLLLSPDLRARLARNGLQRAQQYRWEIAAARSWELFRNLS